MVKLTPISVNSKVHLHPYYYYYYYYYFDTLTIILRATTSHYNSLVVSIGGSGVRHPGNCI